MSQPLKKLYIEATSRCNLNCRMCFRRTWRGEEFGDLDPELFRRVLDDPVLAETDTVFFGGMGEPLLHPALTDMAARAARRGLGVEVITNAALLTERYAAQLLEAGLQTLWVSIDETMGSYGQIQTGGDFDRVLAQLRMFNRLRAGTGVRLGLTAVVMRDTLPHLDAIRALAEDLQADELSFSHMLPCSVEDEAQTLWPLCVIARNESQFARQNLPDEEIGEAGFSSPADYREDDPVPRFEFRGADARRLLPEERRETWPELFTWRGRLMTRRANRCRFIADGCCFIRWDGEVSPCMGLLHSAATVLHGRERMVWRHAFGNVRGQSLLEIWNSPEYRAFRDRVEEFPFSPCYDCGGCLLSEENREDCFGNTAPTCGGCLWGQGFIVCP